jgi:hypothetical protein
MMAVRSKSQSNALIQMSHFLKIGRKVCDELDYSGQNSVQRLANACDDSLYLMETACIFGKLSIQAIKEA